MSNGKYIWIIAKDHGYEGFGEPEKAFLSEAVANEAYALLENTYISYKLFKVPLWGTFKHSPPK